MKRRIISVFLALVLCLSLSITVFGVSGTDGLLFDEADLLSGSEESRLLAQLQSVSQQCGAQIIIVTIPAMDGGRVDDYVEFLYDDMEFGYGASRDGVLLLVCMNPREYRILSNGYAANAISGREIEAIGDAIVSDLSDGYYADAFHGFADRCAYYLEGYVNGFPFDVVKNLLTALVIGLVSGLIVALVLKAQLKSVRSQDQANLYVKRNSMRITAHHDIFLYRNVSRRKRESSSSSRSGSSRNVGGGSF